MSNPTGAKPAWEQADTTAHADDPRAIAFAKDFAQRPIPATGPINTDSICITPSTGYEQLWQAIVPESRTRANDIHLPIVAAYASRLCDAHPEVDRELVMVSIILHDTGWAHVDESRIISEGFQGDWRKAAIRFEHEAEGCNVARRVLPKLGYDTNFIDQVCEIIDGHDTRHVAFSLADALVRDADRLWRFDRAGIMASTSWFAMNPADYVDRLDREILPELISEASHQMAHSDLARATALLRTEVLR